MPEQRTTNTDRSQQGVALNRNDVRQYLKEMLAGKGWFKKVNIIDEICTRHVKLGGHVEIGTDKRAMFKNALQDLCKAGIASKKGRGTAAYWIIHSNENHRTRRDEIPRLHEFGDGNEVVYMVFHDRQRESAELVPTTFGRGTAEGKYPCKIGMTANGEDYIGRVGDQFPLIKTRENPITIGLAYRCDKAEFVEKSIHGLLGIQGRQYISSTQEGKEWFLTDSDEVLGIVKELERLSDVSVK